MNKIRELEKLVQNLQELVSAQAKLIAQLQAAQAQPPIWGGTIQHQQSPFILEEPNRVTTVCNQPGSAPSVFTSGSIQPASEQTGSPCGDHCVDSPAMCHHR